MKRSRVTKFLSVLFWFYMGVMFLGTLHIFRRVFIVERFKIPTGSMNPTLMPGDKVWVNKLLFGSRIYISSDFETHVPLKCWRLPGVRKIDVGDVICFNNPNGYDNLDKIEFNINRIYCKRVLGTPGDRIGAVDGHYWNDKVLRPIGVVQEQEKLRWMFDSVFIWSKCYDVIPLSQPQWNIKNWGPLIVPAKGQTIELNVFTRNLYRQVIEYERDNPIDENLTEYTFRNNYFFAVGDNVMNSYDSRYWGFIPESFIIGIVGGKK